MSIHFEISLLHVLHAAMIIISFTNIFLLSLLLYLYIIDRSNIYVVDWWIIDVFFLCHWKWRRKSRDSSPIEYQVLFGWMHDVVFSWSHNVIFSLYDERECLLDLAKCAEGISQIYYKGTLIFLWFIYYSHKNKRYFLLSNTFACFSVKELVLPSPNRSFFIQKYATEKILLMKTCSREFPFLFCPQKTFNIAI